jgi:hypothetical protein
MDDMRLVFVCVSASKIGWMYWIEWMYWRSMFVMLMVGEVVTQRSSLL